jgi:hypothetical protein
MNLDRTHQSGTRLSDPPAAASESSPGALEPVTRHSGRFLPSTRYRHPGDVIRLIGSGLILTGMLAAPAGVPGLVFGGPPECPGRAYCLPGLKRAYRLRFKAFIPLDARGPLTRQALEAGDIGVALLFTIGPDIPARHLVVLADDRGVQPAENVTPLVRRDVIVRYGPHLVAVHNKVSALLDTGTLRALDARVELAGQDPRLVAGSWLRTHGLIPAGGDAR